MERFPFRTDRLVIVVARAGDALAGRRHAALRDVIDRDFVGLSPDSALHRHLAGHAARLGRGPCRCACIVSGFDAVCRLVAARVGIGIVPEATARRQRRGLPLGIVRIAEPWANRELMLCVRDSRRLSRPAKKLFDALSKHPP